MLKYLDQLENLKLPKGKYALFGSTPLGIRNIRESNDIDIIVKKELWYELIKKYPDNLQKQPFSCLKIGKIEIYYKWMNLTAKIDEMIDMAEIIKGQPFVMLNYFLEWKEYMSREKDKKDIKLVKDYLNNYLSTSI